jgi:hypothetical protein
MRGTLQYLFVGMSVLIIAGCSESTTSPSATPARSLSPEGASLSLNSGARFGGNQTSSFTVTSQGGSFNIGNVYTIDFPANSVCDPSTSSYGAAYWNAPCQTLAKGQSIHITATYGFGMTGPYVDFSPELRFSPSTQVIISTGAYSQMLTTFKRFFASHPSSLHFLGIYYSPSLGAQGQTDAAFDPSLITHVNLTTGIVWRRVKHFSGYSVTTGLPCTPSPDDPDCVDDGGPEIDGGGN